MELFRENIHMKTEYVDQHVNLYTDKYSNGNLALLALDFKTGEPVMALSTNVGPLPPGTLFVCKNYSENEGVDEWLEENRIALPVTEVSVGHTTCPIMLLLIGD